jgi:dienelactone hydrolase
LEITSGRVGEIPVTVYRPAGGRPAPVVVIAHGFAGSQQLMQPFAVTLARNGYLAVTFDFPGHGANPAPFVSRIEDQTRRVRVLRGALESVVDFAAGLPGTDGRMALLGHSMAGDVLTRLAEARRDRVAATVLVSPYLAPDAPVKAPRNLLILFGALEPQMLHQTGREALAAATGGSVDAGVTYGSLAQGDARRLELVPGVEHIGVLYGAAGISAALAWLNGTFDRSGDGFIDHRGPALGLLYLGLLALAWPLARLLPRAASAPLGAGLSWRRLLPVALWPAVLTPLILRLLPSDYLPILLGDYLALHFGVYGLLTAAGARLATRGPAGEGTGRTLWPGLLIGTLAVMAYLILAIALPTDRFVTAFVPGGERLWVLLGILPGTWAYFAADTLARGGPGAPRLAPLLTKTLFLLSLLAAVALNLRELFFLIIIVPAILLFFLLDGLIGGWVYRRTWHPLPGALGMGLLFAWAIAVTFPLVS